MTMSARDSSMFSDDEIMDMAVQVELHDFDRIAPPPQVWNNILAELEVEVASAEATARRRSASWFSPARILSTAAVTLLMVGVAVAVVTQRGDDTQVTELASAVMTDEALQIPTTATAEARFYCETTGEQETCFVDVALSEVPDAGDENLELWVIDGDVSDIRSIGLVTDAEGTYELPAGITPDAFPIIDISFEPKDGVETHSGQSVLRGIFDAT